MQGKSSLRCGATSLAIAFALTAIASVSCKHAGTNSDPKIIGGSKAIEPYGFFATIKKTSADRVRCGGARLSRSFVVTAAHCVADLTFDERLTVGIGPKQLSEANVGKQFWVKQVIIHPKYNTDRITDDIALIELAEDPDLDRSKEYVSLGEGVASVKEGEQLLVLGFGRQSSHGDLTDPDSDYLQEAKIPLIRQDICSALNSKSWAAAGIPSEFTAPVDSSHLCAGFPLEGKVDSCQGDSGGPLVRKTPNGKYELLGVVSRGMEGRCASVGTAGVYARLSAYREWIESVLIDAADPLTKDNFVGRAENSCYMAMNPVKSAGNLRIHYRYDSKQATPWKRDDETLWKSGKPIFACGQTLESDLELKLYSGKDVFDPPFALVQGPGDLQSKVSYKPKVIAATTPEYTIEYSTESKFVFGMFQGIPFIGRSVATIPRRDDKKVVELSQGKFATKVWSTVNNQRFAEIRYQNSTVQYFELLSPKLDRDPEVYFEKDSKRLVIKNLSSSQIVSWNLSCPTCFALQGKDGVTLRGEMSSPDLTSDCGISARYPRDSLAVIPANSSLTFDFLDFDGDIADCRWNRLRVTIK